MVLLVASVFPILILIIGLSEKRRSQKNIDSVPIRININGIRGKSTVTRLITGIMMEADYHTIGKTTGTAARMIYGPENEEPIKRKPEGPNIREQKEVVSKASKLGSDVLVSECMAIDPDYQIVFQEDMLQANIVVIVNVLEDHMDVLGPTLQEVAESFADTIPYDGYVIVNEDEFVPFFEEMAETRRSKLIVCDTSRIPDDFLVKFEYMIFPENAALALAVADVMNIDEAIAFQGMLNANPDPGAMKILTIGDSDNPSYFVNGFSANDATSTLNIWKRIKELGYPVEKPVIIMNSRYDRGDRTKQFAEDVLPYLDIDTLVVIGEGTAPIRQAYNRSKIKANSYLDMEGNNIEKIMETLHPYLTGRTIYGIGNIHGQGEELIEAFGHVKIKNI